jgi:hypothetical protein
LQQNDLVSATILWKARYDAARQEEGLSEADAVYEADKVILRTQSGGGLLMMPKLYRSGLMGRLVSLFNSDPMKSYNMLYEAAMTAGGRTLADNMYRGSMMFVFPPLFYWMSQFLRWPWEDWEGVARFMVNNVTGGLGILGQVVDIVFGVGTDLLAEAEGKRPRHEWLRFSGQFNIPVYSAAQKAAEVFAGKSEWTEDWTKKKAVAFTEGMIDVFSMLKGIPYPGIKRLYQGGAKIIEGAQAKTLTAMDAIRYVTIAKSRMQPNTLQAAMQWRLGTDDWKERKKFIEWYRGLDTEKQEKFRKSVPDFAKKFNRLRSGLSNTPERILNKRGKALATGNALKAQEATEEYESFFGD